MEREEYRNIPVIFISSLRDTVDETRGLLHGAVDYITKPFNPDIVKARIETHLALAETKMTLLRQRAELKRLVEELTYAAGLKEDIERINRHDLKTPIGSVIALPEFLLKDANLTAEQRETIETIRGAGYQMLNMVNSTLDMYKMENGTYKPRITPVDALRLCSTIMTDLRDLAASYSVSFHFIMDGEPLVTGAHFTVAAEESLLFSMLANIIRNAVEASPQGEMVTIELKSMEKATIIVRNKSAIPEQIRTTFFDKYTTYGKEGGTGLGTYSAKLISTTLSGELRYETSSIDGTALVITLPWPVQKAQGKSAIEKVNINELAFLVADDMPDVRMIIKRTLQQMGARTIVTVVNGIQAKDAMESSRFDCIISDWNMPVMNGLELLQWVRKESQQKDIPFVFLTAERREDQVRASIETGVTDYIVKPFTPRMVDEKLKTILHY
jgi:DNA-binding response OmpR family regulator